MASGYFPLNGLARGLFLSPDKKLLCGFSNNRFVVIDTESNTVALKAHLPGNIRNVMMTRASRIVVITEKGIAVWNTDRLQPAATMQGQ
jgi:hypothetical protein